jgi:hypothetical protein
MDMPPKLPTIELVREYRRSNQVVVKQELWNAMTFQMELKDMTLDELVIKALKAYIRDLQEEKIKQDNHASFSEYQLFPHYPSPPFQPHPPWYYNIAEDEAKSDSYSQEVKESKNELGINCTPCGFNTSSKAKRKSSKESHHDKDKK